MFFIVSKLVEALLSPSNLIALLGLLGVIALVIRSTRAAIWLFFASTVLLCISGWSPLGPALVMTLENRLPAPEMPASVTGIVMLGGAEDTHITADRKNVTLNDNSERIFQTAALARRYPQARILLSGGGGHLIVGEGETESQIARRVLVDLGIPSERIETEQHSRTTFENAVESVEVAKPQPSDKWLLVTSAYNMPRAVASFKAVGFITIPFPVDYRTRAGDLRRPMSSIADGLVLTDIAAHEWLGLAAYRIAGKTQSILPAAD